MSELKLSIINDEKKNWSYVNKVRAHIGAEGVDVIVSLQRWQLSDLYFQIQKILHTGA